jgi:outer membrane protein assembly factor BamB
MGDPRRFGLKTRRRLAVAVCVGSLAVTAAGCGGAAAEEWSLPNGDLSNTRVADSSISADNVSDLGVAWTMPLTASATFGAFASNPVIADGTVYLQDLESNVFAVDFESGEVLWTRRYEMKDVGPNGVTPAEGKLYGATPKFVFALDPETGEELWRANGLVGKGGPGFDIQPQVTDGKVYISTPTQIGGGVAYALDAETGEQLWSFDTIIDPVAKKVPAPGAGGAWYPPSVGPDGTVYLGIGNVYQGPGLGISQPSRRLYSDSIVALDPDTGELKWYYQALPNDFYDWDMHLSPIYVEDDGQETIVGGGKMGYVYALDAGSGELRWKTPVGEHNGHDNDSALSLEKKLKITYPLTILPGSYGGVETNMALADGTIYAAVVNMPGVIKSPKVPIADVKFNEGEGEVVALDLSNGEVLWNTRLPSMPLGNATVSNDLVFTTTFDGTLLALSRDDGEIVWQEQLAGGTNAPLAIQGDTLITAASFPQGKDERAEVVAYRLGATGAITPTTTTATTTTGPSEVADGKTLFQENCSSCHTLAAAGAGGTIGPNLDDVQPSRAAVKSKVESGGGGMPSFGGRLTPEEIDAVSAYVASVAGTSSGQPPPPSNQP